MNCSPQSRESDERISGTVSGEQTGRLQRAFRRTGRGTEDFSIPRCFSQYIGSEKLLTMRAFSTKMENNKMR